MNRARWVVVITAGVMLIAACPGPGPGPDKSADLTMDQLAKRLQAIDARILPKLKEVAAAGKNAKPPRETCEEGIAELRQLASAPVLGREWVSEAVVEALNRLLGDYEEPLDFDMNAFAEMCRVADLGDDVAAALHGIAEGWYPQNKAAVTAACAELHGIVDAHQRDCPAKAKALSAFLAGPTGEILYRLPYFAEDCRLDMSIDLRREYCRDDPAVHAAWCDRVTRTDHLTDAIAERCGVGDYKPFAPGRLTLMECGRMDKRAMVYLQKELRRRHGFNKAPKLPAWDFRACKQQLAHEDYRCILAAKDYSGLVGCKGTFMGQGVVKLSLGDHDGPTAADKAKAAAEKVKAEQEKQRAQNVAYTQAMEARVDGKKPLWGHKIDCGAVVSLMQAAAKRFEPLRGAPRLPPRDPRLDSPLFKNHPVYDAKPRLTPAHAGRIHRRAKVANTWIAEYRPLYESKDKAKAWRVHDEVAVALKRCLKGVTVDLYGKPSDGEWLLRPYGTDTDKGVSTHVYLASHPRHWSMERIEVQTNSYGVSPAQGGYQTTVNFVSR